MRIFLFFCFMMGIWSNRIYAQASWPICFESPLSEDGLRLFDDVQHQRYLVSGYQKNSYSGYSTLKGMILSIGYNNDTNTYLYQLGNYDTTVLFSKILPDDHGGFYVFGLAYAAPGYTDDCCLLFAHLDADLVITFYRIIKPDWLTAYYRFSSIALKCSDGFYLGGHYYDIYNHPPRLFMMKLDTLGQVIKSKVFPDGTTPSASFDGMLYNADSTTIWLVGSGHENEGWLARTVLDTSFNVINQKAFENHPNYATMIGEPSQIRWLSDTTFLMSALFYVRITPRRDFDLGFTVYDTSLTYKPVALYGSPDTTDYPAYRETFDFRNRDTICFVASPDHITPIWPERYCRLMVGQLDSALNARYIRYYGDDAYYTIIQVLMASDGGALVLTNKYDYLSMDSQWDVVVWKFDKDGLLVGTDNHPGDSGIGKLALVYPNPGTNQLTIECGSPSATLLMSDMTGNQAIIQNLQQGTNTITTNGLVSGTYLYRIVFSNQETMNGIWIKN